MAVCLQCLAFGKKKPAGAHVMGTVTCFSNGSWAEGWEWKHPVGAGVSGKFLSSELRLKVVLVWKIM